MQIEQREEELEQAEDALNLARARELLSHARWRAEREFPHRWGQKGSLVVVAGAVTLTPDMIGDALSVIQSVSSAPQSQRTIEQIPLVPADTDASD